MKRILRVLTLLCLIAIPSLVQAAVSVTFTSSSNRVACAAASSPSTLAVTFNASATGCTGTPVYTWYYIKTGTTDTATATGAANTRYFSGVAGETFDVVVRVVCGGETAYYAQPAYVQFHPQPVINFTASAAFDPAVICPGNVTFTNTSNGDTFCTNSSGNKWTWTLSGPTGISSTANTTNFSYNFSTPGDYSITLLYIGNNCFCFGNVTKVIHVSPLPVACMTRTDANSLCKAPVTVTYDAGCSTGATTYTWNLGGVSFPPSSSATQSRNFTGPGDYPINLTVTNAAGCTATAPTQTIHIGNLTANFLTSPTVFCENDTVTFHDRTTVDAVPTTTSMFYIMDPVLGSAVGGLSMNPVPGPDAFFTLTLPGGTYQVWDVVTNGNGCMDTVRRNITIRPAPHTSVTLSPVPAYMCAVSAASPLNVTFAANPVVATNTYTWSFGTTPTTSATGTGSTGANVAHSYTVAPGSGFYTPTLRVVDNFGCVFDTALSQAVSIRAASLTAHVVADSGCLPLRDSFFFTMSPAGIGTNYIIDGVNFGDGSPTAPGGSYTGISHLYTTGPAVPGTPYHVAVNWHLPPSLGGCSGTDTVDVLIGATTPNFSVFVSTLNFDHDPGGLPNTDSICPNTPIFFTANGCPGCTWSWFVQPGPGSAIIGHPYDTVSVNFPTPSTPPPSGLLLGLPAYQYVTTGCLAGCCVSDTNLIWVYPPLIPTPSLTTPNPLRINTAATGTPSAPAGTASHCNKRDSVDFVLVGTYGAHKYVWDFGDPSSPTNIVVKRPTSYPLPNAGTSIYAAHNYNVSTATAHFYTVTVTAYDTTALGMYDTSIVVGGVPDTFFRRHTSCFNVARLVVYVGPSDTAWRMLTPDICVNTVDSVVGPTYYDSTIPAQVRYSNYRWQWGDGSLPVNVTDSFATHVYTAAGTYSVRPIFTNRIGCNDTGRYRPVRVYGPYGHMTASSYNVCAGSTVTITDNNTVPLSTVYRRNVWYDYDNHSLPSDATALPTTMPPFSFTHTFPEGSWLVALVDTDASPRRCASFDTIRIKASMPHAYFTTADTTGACAGVAIAFHDTNTGVSYTWNFGDGVVIGPSTTLSDPTHIYSSNGTFNVSCTVTTTGVGGAPIGCSNTYSRTITLSNASGIGIANYGELGSACPPMLFAAGPTSTATSYLYNIAWHVYVNDEATYTTPIVFATFTHTGLHHVVMYATSPRGCTDSTSADYVVGGPNGTIVASSLGGCTPQDITFSFTDSASVPGGSRYIWNVCPAGTIDTTTPSISLSYTTPGVYCPPSLIIQNGGCVIPIDNFTDSIRIYDRPVDTITHAPRICYGGSDTLRVSGMADTFKWEGPGGLICGNCTFIVVHPLVTTTYTVTGINAAGCSDVDLVTVNVDSPIVVTITGRDSMCIGEQTTLTASGGSGVFHWVTHPTPTDSSGLSCSVCNPVIVRATSTHTYWAITTNSLGCTDSASHKVTINPLPILSYSPNPAYICEGTAKHITVSGAASYLWTPRIGLSCDSCASPNVLINDNIIYSVTGTTQFGCRDSMIVPVEVFHHNVTGVRSDTIICYGDQAQLSAQGGESYIWTPASSLNSSTIYNPIATPTVTTIYTVYITENPCFKDTQNVKVTVIPTPLLHVPPTTTIIAGNSVQLYVDTLNSVVLTSWAWTPADSTLTCSDCPRPIATPVVTTTYSVSASTIEGCTGYASVTIKLLCQSDQVFIPNTFTPNGDGNNDRFYVSGKGLGLIKRMAIYNRWGELVHEAYNVYPNNPAVGWDGTFRGEVLAPDVYIYVLDVVCSTGEPFTFRGDISLVR